jgi:transposase
VRMGLPSLQALDRAQSTRIWLATEASDMRCGFDRLAERVRGVIGQDPLSGHYFVFRSRRGDRLKILLWDRDGFLLWYKRLESGVFKLPRVPEGAHSLELRAVVVRLATHHFVPGCSLRDPGREHVAVRRVREWLEAHPEQNVSVHSLANVGLSPYYLMGVFHKHVGVPLHQYQTIVRVHRARKLLRSGTAISEVAYSTGFCDQSHLNRCLQEDARRYTREICSVLSHGRSRERKPCWSPSGRDLLQ